jgi:hypothetical protein
MSVKENWGNSSSLLRRTAKTVGVLSTVAAVYAMINLIMGTTVRPAWAWEVNELSIQQLDTALKVEHGDRREFSRDLSRYRAMRDSYIRRDESIPEWLTDEINSGENDLLKIDNDIEFIQQELVNKS